MVLCSWRVRGRSVSPGPAVGRPGLSRHRLSHQPETQPGHSWPLCFKNLNYLVFTIQTSFNPITYLWNHYNEYLKAAIKAQKMPLVMSSGKLKTITHGGSISI